ncbi:hypothetical protein EC991_001079 [Linnemannia zychae]|nr:hypothetical protein EC991_001079 [Linnemannia zychae]
MRPFLSGQSTKVIPTVTPPSTPTHFQRFRHERDIESLAVHEDSFTGELYCFLDDVKNILPNAFHFKLDGKALNFMRDTNGHLYEPKRIAHFPEAIIDVVCTALVHEPLTPPNSNPNRAKPKWIARSPEAMVGVVSTASTHGLLTPPDSITDKTKPNQVPRCHFSTSPESNNGSISPFIQTEHAITTSAKASSTLSPTDTKFEHQHRHHHSLATTHETSVREGTFKTNQGRSQYQCERWGASQLPAHPGDSIEHTIHHLHELLQGQAQMRREQEEAKEREKQILRNQQGLINRLIANQERIDVLLVQNYELHEYPIPRLFVIMPERQSKWDLTKGMIKKYRLHFLCECSDNHHHYYRPKSTSSSHSVFEEEGHIPYKNRVHLTEHEGYELTRPREFFEQYGAFVLGTLEILKHCMEVAAMVTPLAGMVGGTIKMAISEVSSFAKDHLDSISNSIGFLKDTLDEHQVNLGLGRDNDGTDQQDDHLDAIAALEGADLRRLHTFLRENDKNTVLGNLFRITTDAGHVKWVCAKHYGEKYRNANRDAFVHSVKAAGGHYDGHFRRITITLKSSTSAKDFFRRLATQGSTINELCVTFDWKFRSNDLRCLVDKIALSNIQVLNIDLMDREGWISKREVMGLSRGKYHPLLGLLSNTKLTTLCFVNLSFLGPRTPDLHATQMASSLRSFHFFGEIQLEDDARLAKIISSCPGLVDLRLGSGGHSGNLGKNLHRAICSLKNLQSLHLQCMYRRFELDHATSIYMPKAMKEIVGSTVVFGHLLAETVQRSLSTLEVLVLESHNMYQHHFAMVPDLKSGSHPGPKPYELPTLGVQSATSMFSKLTHIDLCVKLTERSLFALRIALPFLRLIHFGSVHYTGDLLKYVNFATVKSLSIGINRESDLQPLQHFYIDKAQPCQIDSLKLEYYHQVEFTFPDLLRRMPLKRLQLSHVKDERRLCQLLEAVNFSRLQVLTIYECYYSEAAEAILTRRSGDFLDSLAIELDQSSILSYSNDIPYLCDPQKLVTQLPTQWVKHLGHVHRDEIHYRFLQPILPITCY